MLWAEGPTVVDRLLRSTLRTRAVLVTPVAWRRMLDRGVFDGRGGRDGVDVLLAEQQVVNTVVGFDLHRGVIAMADRPLLAPLPAMVGSARRLVVLEGLNDPENLGAIARSARALGADGLVLDPTCADPYYRRSVRVSMGEILHLPVARAAMSATLAELDAAGFEVWALTPRRDATPLDELARAGVPGRLALVMGAEGPGLSDAVLGSCRAVRIGQRDDVDSLNVGHATAAALAVVAAFAT